MITKLKESNLHLHIIVTVNGVLGKGNDKGEPTNEMFCFNDEIIPWRIYNYFQNLPPSSIQNST